MADLDLCYTPATELAARIRDRKLSPVELMKNTLARIEAVNPKLNCFCFVYPEEALAKARAAEQAVTEGRALGPLHGVPIAIKDLTPTKGKRTTLGSYTHENWVPDRNAVIVDRLEAAGAIMVGKTTTPEFAYSSFTESPLWGITRNPWDPGKTPGGSSGGSGRGRRQRLRAPGGGHGHGRLGAHPRGLVRHRRPQAQHGPHSHGSAAERVRQHLPFRAAGAHHRRRAAVPGGGAGAGR